jgi:hypothetical protein
MKKYFIVEILLILLFITSFKLIGSISIPTEFENLSFIYFTTLMLLIIVILPAIIILSLTEKYAPDMMPSKRKGNPFAFPKDAGLKITTSAFILSWTLYFLFSKMGLQNYHAVVISSVIVSFIFGVIYKFYLEKKQGRMRIKELIMPFIIAILVFVSSAIYFMITR